MVGDPYQLPWEDYGETVTTNVTERRKLAITLP